MRDAHNFSCSLRSQKIMANKIYLDNAATTPLDKKVFESMKPYFSDKFGNASSIHSFGIVASEAVEKARGQVADFFGSQTNEIIFTSGATESNNWALKGVTKKYQAENKKIPHIITTAFEHSCVLESCKALERNKKAEITYLPVYKDGIVKIEDIQKAIKPNTLLISIMYVNNEIGTVQPIAEIGRLIKKINEANKLKAESHKLLFHTDATQAINYFDCKVDKLGVDLLSMSAHKIYGPKGVGVLYIRKGTPIVRKQDGGAQEFGLRAGTLNTPGIVGLGKAIEQVKSRKLKVKSIVSLRDYLIQKVLKEIPDSNLNGSKIKRSPNNANFIFSRVEGESLLMMLDAEGVFGSTGSACSSGSLKPSHVLLSLGLKPEEAHSSLRLTLGKDTTKKDIDYTSRVIKKVVEKLRKFSGNVLEDFYKNNNS